MEANVIPKGNRELADFYGEFVAEQVRHLNKRPENNADILQAVWLRLIVADVIGKFHARERKSRPESLLTEEVCLHLAISVDSWLTAQEGYQAGDRTIPWMPSPLEGSPDSLAALWGVDDILQYGEVAHQYHEKAGESDCLIPVPTAAKFRTYLMWCVHNAFANWCRTYSRRHRERAIDLYVRPPSGLDSRGADLFDLVLDSDLPLRRLEAGTAVRETLRHFALGATQDDFVGLLSEGYTALEAASKLNLPKQTVRRIESVLML